MVPIAPSSTTMRSANRARSFWARSAWLELFIGGLRCCRSHAERVADGVGELGAVQCVEMELVDSVLLQLVHLLDGDRGRDQLARLGIVVESVEAMLQPV